MGHSSSTMRLALFCALIIAVAPLRAGAETMVFPCVGSPEVSFGDVRMAICDGNPEWVLTSYDSLSLLRAPIIRNYIDAVAPEDSAITVFNIMLGSPDDRSRHIEAHVAPTQVEINGLSLQEWKHQFIHVYRGHLADGASFVVGCHDRPALRIWTDKPEEAYSICSTSIELTDKTMAHGSAFAVSKENFMDFVELITESARSLRRR